MKLKKIVKKKSAKTSVCGNKCFGGPYNETSSQLKKYGWPKVLVVVSFFGEIYGVICTSVLLIYMHWDSYKIKSTETFKWKSMWTQSVYNISAYNKKLQVHALKEN